MNKPWINLAFYIFVIIARFPRIKERWSAPLLRGTDWFFDAAVPADFWKGPGAALLRNYRWRLFIPWGIEGAILLALWAASRITPLTLTLLVFSITLFTRFNYYAARMVTENRARAFEPPDAIQPATKVALSLEPRTLWNYTNWWAEAAIALLFGAAAVWMAFSTTSDPLEPRKFIGVLIVSIYVQVGLLLVKLGIVRSSSVAPAENVEQYLAWRDSLRRFAIRICDLSRAMFALYPLLLLCVIKGGSARLTAAIAFGILFIAFLIYEWRSRLKHLEVARRTRPARFPLLPAARNARGLLGFWPSLPVLLLRTANGYALNLAAAPVRIAGVYFAGFAGLCVWLAR
jgi:hypothetical protein